MKLRYLPLRLLARPTCTSPDTKAATAAPADGRFDRFKNHLIQDL